MNCKPGDMAVVVKGTNIGAIVTVEGVSHSYGHPYWRVRNAWPVRCWYPDGTSAFCLIASCHDARLRPIRPDGQTDALITRKDIGVPTT